METPGESVIDASVGFIFCPTNEEIISTLKHKRSHPDFNIKEILEDNLYKYEPHSLPEVEDIQSGGKRYFFCERNPLNPGGDRFSRSTQKGYWKATGKVLPIKAKGTGEEIGAKRTLVFYLRFPGGYEERTNWVMHEYSDDNNTKDLVVCKIKEKREKRKTEDRKRCISTKNKNKPAKKRCISANDVFQAEPPRSDAVENTYSERHYHPVYNFNNHVVEETLQVDSLPLGNLNVLNGSTHLDETTFSTESPILQGSSSSGVSTTEIEVWNPSFGSGSEGEDYLQEWVFADLDEVLIEETGHTGGFCGGEDYLQEWVFADLDEILIEETGHTAGFCGGEDYLQEWVFADLDEVLIEETGHTGGFCGGNNSDVSTENFNAWANEVFRNDTSEACLNYI